MHLKTFILSPHWTRLQKSLLSVKKTLQLVVFKFFVPGLTNMIQIDMFFVTSLSGFSFYLYQSFLSSRKAKIAGCSYILITRTRVASVQNVKLFL